MASKASLANSDTSNGKQVAWPSGVQTSSRGALSRVKDTGKTVLQHIIKHTGVGIICSVAYFDPGNWGVDLQAGSQYGYKLLFVVLCSGICAVFLQILASRLGCVTGLDLASHCRLLLHSRPKHTKFYRWGMLYPLYILAEGAIIATDLAELLGSAIALVLLFPKLPLWAGVLITGADVLLLLAMKDPLGGSPVKAFEFLIGGMVFSVLICMGIIIGQVGPKWGDAFDGYVPSKQVFGSGALYVSIGIIGATVMPHSIFLGSALATQDRLEGNYGPTDAARTRRTDTPDWGSAAPDSITDRYRPSFFSRFRTAFLELFRVSSIESMPNDPKSHAEHENKGYAFVRAHIYHGMVDITVSLLGIAVVINSMILILASAVFFYGKGAGSGGPASLFDAYDLLKDIVGRGAAILFALALLAAGQASSIIATMAGQTVSEGFLRWRVSPIMRRLLTRALGLIPSMAVAIALGRSGVDALLVASQVALSIVLPFIVFPLLVLTSSSEVMTVKRALGAMHADHDDKSDTLLEEVGIVQLPVVPEEHSGRDSDGKIDLEENFEYVDYSNGRIAQAVGWFLWVLIVAANMYAIVSLGLGDD